VVEGRMSYAISIFMDNDDCCWPSQARGAAMTHAACFEYNVAGTEREEGGNKKYDIPDYYGHKIH
jgi:hypothetical protein